VAKLKEQLARLEAELQKKQQAAAVAGKSSVSKKSGRLQGPEPEKAKDPQVVTAPPPVPWPWPEPQPPIVSDGACDGLLVSVSMSKDKPCIKPGSGQSFKDCQDCPEMVIAPPGSFMMGSPEPERGKFERPQRMVRIAKPFAVGRFAVTFAEWDVCVEAGGCGGYKPKDEGWGRNDRPVINVSWDDAKAYVAWLSKKTGMTYRLLSEAEREYAARAGTTTYFWWGSSITPNQANYSGSLQDRQKTLPVKSFRPNPWGLYQVHGNVWEWVEDCWHGSFDGAPPDGSVWTSGDCRNRVSRGGSWYIIAEDLRSAIRRRQHTFMRSFDIGFRVARTLD
jgi:formylglycine-generating enzyme required for sulfatase activity